MENDEIIEGLTPVLTRETTCPPPPLLYKFGNQCYLEPFLNEGSVSFAVATTYKDSVFTEGQQDDESTREFFPDPTKHRITVGEGAEMKPINNFTNLKVAYNLKGRDGADLKYYIWCASLGYSNNLLSEFKANACVRINDPEVFGNRLLVAARKQFPSTTEGIPGCDLYGRDIVYYDTKSLPPTTEQKDLVFLKKNQYKHQSEFRFIFATDPEKKLPDRFAIQIGSLRDIAEFYVG